MRSDAEQWACPSSGCTSRTNPSQPNHHPAPCPPLCVPHGASQAAAGPDITAYVEKPWAPFGFPGPASSSAPGATTKPLSSGDLETAGCWIMVLEAGKSQTRRASYTSSLGRQGRGGPPFCFCKGRNPTGEGMGPARSGTPMPQGGTVTAGFGQSSCRCVLEHSVPEAGLWTAGPGEAASGGRCPATSRWQSPPQ